MEHADSPIGRVTRCSTRGFVGAVRVAQPHAPVFGSFCRVAASGGGIDVIGLIYDISIEDDALARQLATADGVSAEQIADSQRNRQVPIEFSSLVVGFQEGGVVRQTLPPQPPMTLNPVYALSTEGVRLFTEQLSFITHVLGNTNTPVDDLLIACLRNAGEARPAQDRLVFLQTAGRACARMLTGDLQRLEYVLRGISS